MIEKVIQELYDYAMFGEKMNLENMKKLCSELGNPQDKMRTIHIAGTNGKGSTSTTIEMGLLEAGYKVGKYTSPHILKFNERISFNGKDISDEDVVKYYYIVKNIITKLGMNPSYFEVTTTMMYKFLADKEVDFLVLETGLGGRLDATNISKGEIAVITNISMDHCEYLGDNFDQISREKLGIVKKDSTLIIGRKSQELEKNSKATEAKKIIFVQDRVENSNYKLNFENFTTEITIGEKTFEFALFGEHQYQNFLTAYTVLKELEIDDETIAKAAKKVVWPARFEVLRREKTVILDGAHNIDGVEKLKNTLLMKYRPEDIFLITSILKDKDRENMAKVLCEISKNIVLTSLVENKRGSLGEDMVQYFNSNNIKVENNIEKAYKLGLESNAKIILICGSFYLISKFKEVVING